MCMYTRKHIGVWKLITPYVFMFFSLTAFPFNNIPWQYRHISSCWFSHIFNCHIIFNCMNICLVSLSLIKNFKYLQISHCSIFLHFILCCFLRNEKDELYEHITFKNIFQITLNPCSKFKALSTVSQYLHWPLVLSNFKSFFQSIQKWYLMHWFYSTEVVIFDFFLFVRHLCLIFCEFVGLCYIFYWTILSFLLIYMNNWAVWYLFYDTNVFSDFAGCLKFGLFYRSVDYGCIQMYKNHSWLCFLNLV